MKARAALVLLALVGCTTTKITHTNPGWLNVGTNLLHTGGGFVIERTTWMSKHSVATLAAGTGSNGVSFEMKGYRSDSVEALEAAAAGAARGTVEGLKKGAAVP